jgi:hypothetical protein
MAKVPGKTSNASDRSATAKKNAGRIPLDEPRTGEHADAGAIAETPPATEDSPDVRGEDSDAVEYGAASKNAKPCKHQWVFHLTCGNIRYERCDKCNEIKATVIHV